VFDRDFQVCLISTVPATWNIFLLLPIHGLLFRRGSLVNGNVHYLHFRLISVT